MKHRTTLFILIAGLATMLPLVPQVSAQSAAAADRQPDPDYADEYNSGEYGRVLYRENGLTLVRSDRYDDPRETPQAGRDFDVNTPIFPGDRAQTGELERAEFQLAEGALLRLDERSDLAFLALPNPYADFKDSTILQLERGTLRVSADIQKDDEFRIDTPAASIYLLGSGDMRVDVDGSGYTVVTSRQGVVEVVGDDGSVLVRSGNRTDVYPGSLPARAASYNTFGRDRFDRWVERRESEWLDYDRYGDSRDSYQELPYEVRPYHRELSAHGQWRRHNSYGWVWAPRGVGADWRPYNAGYWDYGPGGYFWVSNEPWGWAPYRYGRWAYDDGWCWIPGRVFSGAWVAWSFGSVNVGWAPLDYYNRPVFVTSLLFGRYCPQSWNFIGYRHLGYHSYRNHYVGLNRLEADLHRAHIVARAPRSGPGRLGRDPEARRRAIGEATDTRARRIDASRDGGKGQNFRANERIATRSPRGNVDTADRLGSRGGRGPSTRVGSPNIDRRTTGAPTDRRSSARGRTDADRSSGGRVGATRPQVRSDRTGTDSEDTNRDRRSRVRATPQSRQENSTGTVRPRVQGTRDGADTTTQDRRSRVRPRPESPKDPASAGRDEKSRTSDDRRSIYQRMAGPRSSTRSGSSGSSDARTTPRPRAAPESRSRPSRTEDRTRATPPQKRPASATPTQPRSKNPTQAPKKKEPTKASGKSSRDSGNNSASSSRSSSSKTRSSSSKNRGAARRN